MALIRRRSVATPPPEIPATPAVPDERTHERRTGDRRGVPERRMRLGAARTSTAEIVARAAQRTIGPTAANSAADREGKQREAGKRIDEQLKLIAKCDADIDDAVLRQTAAHKVIDAELRGALMSVHSNGVYIAEIIEQFSRQSRTIDPKKFKNQVESNVFWASIKVSLEKAGEHMTEKEIAAISDVVPAKSMGYALKVKKLEPIKRTKK